MSNPPQGGCTTSIVPPQNRQTAGVGPPLKKSRTRAAGLSSAHHTIWGAQGSRVRLTDDSLAPRKILTSVPAASHPIPDSRGFISVGRELRWTANKEEERPSYEPIPMVPRLGSTAVHRPSW